MKACHRFHYSNNTAEGRFGTTFETGTMQDKSDGVSEIVGR